MAAYGDNAPHPLTIGTVTLEGAAARFAQHLLTHGNQPARPAVVGCGKQAGERVLQTLRDARVLKFEPTIINSMASHMWRLTDAAYAEARV